MIVMVIVAVDITLVLMLMTTIIMAAIVIVIAHPFSIFPTIPHCFFSSCPFHLKTMLIYIS